MRIILAYKEVHRSDLFHLIYHLAIDLNLITMLWRPSSTAELINLNVKFRRGSQSRPAGSDIPSYAILSGLCHFGVFITRGRRCWWVGRVNPTRWVISPAAVSLMCLCKHVARFPEKRHRRRQWMCFDCLWSCRIINKLLLPCNSKELDKLSLLWHHCSVDGVVVIL